MYYPAINAEELTTVEVESSVLSNSISENRFPASVILGEDINAAKSVGSNLGHIPGISNSDYGAAVWTTNYKGLGRK